MQDTRSRVSVPLLLYVDSRKVCNSSLAPADAASFETQIDEDERTVAITYADDMPLSIVIWRPVLGRTQLPMDARKEDRQYLPQVASDIRSPDLDAEDWPLGDRNAIATLPAATGNCST